MANIVILEAYLKSRSQANKTSAAVGIDITKAFETVSHTSVERALIRKGVDSNTTKYIINSMKDTTFKLEGATTRPFTINRGVRQGDPLSPLLFNLVLDEYLTLPNFNES